MKEPKANKAGSQKRDSKEDDYQLRGSAGRISESKGEPLPRNPVTTALAEYVAPKSIAAAALERMEVGRVLDEVEIDDSAEMAARLARDIMLSREADIVQKWGEEVAGRGFAQIPNYLLLLNQFLDEEAQLSAIELLVLIQIVSMWWRKRELPYPSMSTLATRCGVSERQVQRAVTRLEKLKLLARVKRPRDGGIIASNAYDLYPLAMVLEKVAEAYPNAYPRQLRPKKATVKGRGGKVKL